MRRKRGPAFPSAGWWYATSYLASPPTPRRNRRPTLTPPALAGVSHDQATAAAANRLGPVHPLRRSGAARRPLAAHWLVAGGAVLAGQARCLCYAARIRSAYQRGPDLVFKEREQSAVEGWTRSHLPGAVAD